MKDLNEGEQRLFTECQTSFPFKGYPFLKFAILEKSLIENGQNCSVWYLLQYIQICHAMVKCNNQLTHNLFEYSFICKLPHNVFESPQSLSPEWVLRSTDLYSHKGNNLGGGIFIIFLVKIKL